MLRQTFSGGCLIVTYIYYLEQPSELVPMISDTSPPSLSLPASFLVIASVAWQSRWWGVSGDCFGANAPRNDKRGITYLSEQVHLPTQLLYQGKLMNRAQTSQYKLEVSLCYTKPKSGF